MINLLLLSINRFEPPYQSDVCNCAVGAVVRAAGDSDGFTAVFFISFECLAELTHEVGTIGQTVGAGGIARASDDWR